MNSQLEEIKIQQLNQQIQEFDLQLKTDLQINLVESNQLKRKLKILVQFSLASLSSNKMIKNKSIFEEQEQNFARPLDNNYARFDVNSAKKGQRYSDEYDYNYQRDQNIQSIQVSQRSYQENKLIQNSLQNTKRQNEILGQDVDFEESENPFHVNSSQQIQNLNQNYQQEQKGEVNMHFKNYIAYLKQKNSVAAGSTNSEQKMQNPSQQNGLEQYIKSISISPISNNSPIKSDSLSHSQEEQEEGASEISQIQQYIKRDQMKRDNQNNKQIQLYQNASREEIISDNLDYAEMIIKKVKQPSKIQHDIPENRSIKKALISQFQENQEEHFQALPVEEVAVQDEKAEGSNEQIFSKESALQKAKDVNLSDYIPQQAIRLSLENQKKILFQGELQKYKPGLNYNFISRYITLSLENLKYYKDRVHSKCYEDKPLYVLPISCIQSVARVSFSVPLLPKELQRQKKNLQKLYPDNLAKNVVVYYFEIIIDLNNLKTCREENDSNLGNKIHNTHLMPQDKLDSYRNGELNKKIKDLTTWSGRSHEWYESEQRLVFCTQDKTTLETWVTVLNWIISLRRDQQISSYSHIYSTERLSD